MDGIHPAHLSFLAIYNPSLGKTEETEHDQILYYYSSKASKAKNATRNSNLSPEEIQHEERNEQMRQVGLAQGMVGFARAFSDDTTVDYVDTEKARAWMHELEPGWWIIAHVDLTRIEAKGAPSKTKIEGSKETAVEYSSRELCPQGLLREQFLRAHSIFLLHHGASLGDIYARRGRQRLCAVMEKFWNRTLRQWDVLMHGAPATDIFNGMKLAAGGELGIGVGEEEWGSGERAVLEDLVHNTEGLVDVMVSRFGEPPALEPKKPFENPELWLGSGALPVAADGVIFSGVGSITREAQKRVSAWMELIIKHGTSTYGVQDSPHSTRKPRRRRKQPELERKESSQDRVPRAEIKIDKARSPVPVDRPSGIPPPLVSPDETADGEEAEKGIFDTDNMVKYMTLGIYGSSWGIPSGRPSVSPSSKSSQRKAQLDRKPHTLEEKAVQLAQTQPDIVRGCFIVGMEGDLHFNDPASDIDDNEAMAVDINTGTDDSNLSGQSAWDRRNSLRTLYIERATSFSLKTKTFSSKNITSVVDRLRVIVYARQPFLYTFLFDASKQPGLSFPKFYRNLHNQLAPLHTPLIRTTSPEDVRRRLWEAAAGITRTESALASTTAPIYDLVFDPTNGTSHTTLPNIPEIGEASEETGAPWSRVDAVAVHTLILKILMDTRRRESELERTARTTRGWWVVWMRLPSPDEQPGEKTGSSGAAASKESPESGTGNRSGSQGTENTRSESRTSAKGNRLFREAFLVRRAPEKMSGAERRRTSSGLWGGGTKAEEEGTGSLGPAKLAEGIGIDTRKYIEGLLSLNR